MNLDFTGISSHYPGQAEPVLSELTLRIGRGFTGVAGANGSGKTTLLLLACGLLKPTGGHVRIPGSVAYCPQRTDQCPEDLLRLLETPDSLAAQLVSRLGLGPSWTQRWDTLSHGERKRAQIGCALWHQADVLAIDEPTNHVDAATRQFLITALRQYRGIGLLVSHDRQLLDELCTNCLIFEHGTPVLRGGGYSEAHAAAEREMESLQRQKQNATQTLRSLAAMAAERRREADRSVARLSKRHVAKGDSDGRGKINLARSTGKGGTARRQVRQLQGRLDQATERAEALFVPKSARLTLELCGEVSRRRVLLQLNPGMIDLCPTRHLRFPRLQIGCEDRIGIIGPNGCGKSSLVHHLLAVLGSRDTQVLYLPQEIGVEQSRAILAGVKHLDSRQLGAVMSGIATLGSEPSRVLATETPSPGELRKLLLALGLSERPNLIIMDEPTNHLDLPSIQCLENALAECHCSLVLVSHDALLVQRLTRTVWSIAEMNGEAVLTVCERVPGCTRDMETGSSDHGLGS
ncbi:MAG: ATP-binding cassette domain-containing protein [Bacillota bacterium]